MWELLIFIGIGGVGGLLGAGTVHLSKRLTLRRQSQTTTENAIEVCVLLILHKSSRPSAVLRLLLLIG